ncbi:hypothetical protein KP509_02G020100 [Ceratopteris richardii]|uniref:Uncharacterized protein n=1 Tax=Ceratopteris richardii TaxID=49495 RepID=A0A8T2VBU6_CERRI|nr:hypothetical protein KP509_02G020100 [Ceratopteris richardii]
MENTRSLSNSAGRDVEGQVRGSTIFAWCGTSASQATASPEEEETAFRITQNVIGALISVLVLVVAFITERNVSTDPDDRCASIMFKPVLCVGAALLFMCLFGLGVAILERHGTRSVSSHRKPIFKYFALMHFIMLFILVLVLFTFAIFSLEVTNANFGSTVHAYGTSYKEYRLYQYPAWMRHIVERPKYWAHVRRCLSNSKLCDGLNIPNFSSNNTNIDIQKLSSVQKGCCIPPSACHVTYTGSEIEPHEIIGRWDENHSSNIPTDTLMVEELLRHATNEVVHAYTHDCKHWNSNPYVLCYDCDTCKAGVIQGNMNKWRIAGITFVVIIAIMVMMVGSFACFGFVQEKT